MKRQHTPEDGPEIRDGYGEDGVDLTLIRWMLAKTPLERLQTLQSSVRSLGRLRGDPSVDS